MADLSDEAKNLENKGEQEARDKLQQRFSGNDQQQNQQDNPDQDPTGNSLQGQQQEG